MFKLLPLLFLVSFLDYYDAVTIVGGIAVGLVPAGALFEMIRIVKPGLLWFFCCSGVVLSTYLYKY